MRVAALRWSNIERDKVLRTILTLEKIAEKFSIDITEFFQFERNDGNPEKEWK